MESRLTFAPPEVFPDPASVGELSRRLDNCGSVVVLTGAGCSTDSGIPDYRGDDGEWKRPRPMLFDEFRRSSRNRRRYWARNYVGWQVVRDARPNGAHIALAALEQTGPVRTVLTQNVDGLHSAAGSREVIELHGNANRVVCLDCGALCDRLEMQGWLAERNRGWTGGSAVPAPDADASVADELVGEFQAVDCPSCGGILKPDVVFFGESVPKLNVERGFAAVDACDLLLVAGSSLAVWSGFRFVRRAAERGIPIAIVNRGRTRGDDLASFRIHGNCAEVLGQVSRSLRPSRSA